MRSLPARLWSRLGQVLDHSGTRVALSFAILAGVLVIAGSAISFWSVSNFARQKELAAMELAAADEANRLAESLESFSRAIGNLAADEAIASAVVDSEGRNRHLAPMLRLVQTTLLQQFKGQAPGVRSGEPVIAVLDYQGRWLLGSPGALPEHFSDAPWIQAAAAGVTSAHLDPARHVIYVAHPVIFRATGMPEGVLVGAIELSDATKTSTRSPRWQEVVGTTRDTGRLTGDASRLAVLRRVHLAEPLAELQLFIAVGIARSELDADARGILRPHLAVALAGLVAALLTGLAIARRMDRPLARLAEAARLLNVDDGHRMTAFSASAAGGSSEVRLLARTLDDAVAALGRSNARARLASSALDAARDGIVIADASTPDLPLIYVNPAFEAITGYGSQEALGHNCRFLHAQDASQPALERLRDALRKRGPGTALLRNWRRDGSLFWNELSIAPVRDADGRLTHYVGVQRDVSERVRREEHLRASQKLESLGQLTGGLAHDFNNLLGIVIGNLDLLAELLPEGSPERARSDTALQAALRGAAVTRSLLAVARRQRLEPQAVDVNERIREMIPLVSNTAGRRVTTVTEIADTPMPSLVDIGGLDTAVLNLAINARDAMSEAGGLLTLRTSWLQVPESGADPELGDLPPGSYVRIDVIDNGCGMSDEVRQHVFEPFFTTKPSGQGTGLGLSMAYGFARQSGGTATVSSEKGRGTTASLILPALSRGPADR